MKSIIDYSKAFISENKKICNALEILNNNQTINYNYSIIDSTIGEFVWAQLIVTDYNGCKDTIRKNSGIHPLPTVDFTAQDICEGDQIIANSTSFMSSPNNFPADVITNGIWTLEDGLTNIYTSLPNWTGYVPSIAGDFLILH